MKLSEAISLGAMLTPQAIGSLVDARGGHCAWASALDAVGHSRNICEEWKWTERIIRCPACQAPSLVSSTIAHLNDQHLWTRHRIAEWVSTIEPTEETSREGEEFSFAE